MEFCPVRFSAKKVFGRKSFQQKKLSRKKPSQQKKIWWVSTDEIKYFILSQVKKQIMQRKTILLKHNVKKTEKK